MVTIENKKFTISIEGLNDKNEKITIAVDLTYNKLMLDCVDRPSNPQTGFTTDDIRKITKIEKILKTNESQPTIKMEDADFEFVRDKVSTMTWKYRKADFVDFVDYIKTLKSDV